MANKRKASTEPAQTKSQESKFDTLPAVPTFEQWCCDQPVRTKLMMFNKAGIDMPEIALDLKACADTGTCHALADMETEVLAWFDKQSTAVKMDIYAGGNTLPCINQYMQEAKAWLGKQPLTVQLSVIATAAATLPWISDFLDAYDVRSTRSVNTQDTTNDNKCLSAMRALGIQGDRSREYLRQLSVVKGNMYVGCKVEVVGTQHPGDRVYPGVVVKMTPSMIRVVYHRDSEWKQVDMQVDIPIVHENLARWVTPPAVSLPQYAALSFESTYPLTAGATMREFCLAGTRKTTVVHKAMFGRYDFDRNVLGIIKEFLPTVCFWKW
jgi:hypothetical protein